MRILIIADEVWNDNMFGNNVLTNWFRGMKDVELAEIYASPGLPLNDCCERYFQVTDAMMATSVLGRKAGNTFTISLDQMRKGETGMAQQQPQKFYRFMKSITGTGLRMVRDSIWLLGRYDKEAMQRFVDNFNPDIVFCPRLLTPKLCRLEKMVNKMTQAPIVAFTGDDEASFKEVSYSPLYWLRRVLFRRAFDKNMPIYSQYLMHSQDQAAEYTKLYGVKTDILMKCGDFVGEQTQKNVGTPITLVYAGRLYCNRWKTLSAIGDALKIINAGGLEKIKLDVYTQDFLNNKQRVALCEKKHIYLKGSVSPDELKQVYHKADIALHVESFDKKYKYATRFSFSTKIIDLMESSCAIIAICWDQQTGYQYLSEKDAAFCISSYSDILPSLQSIVDKPMLITEYAEKAWNCGKENHQRQEVQSYLRNIFQKTIDKNVKC